MNFGYGGPFRPGYPSSGNSSSGGKHSATKMTRSTLALTIVLAFVATIVSAIAYFYLFRFFFGPLVVFIAPVATFMTFSMVIVDFSRGYAEERILKWLSASGFGLMAGTIAFFTLSLIIGFIIRDTSLTANTIIIVRSILGVIFLVTAIAVTISMRNAEKKLST